MNLLAQAIGVGIGSTCGNFAFQAAQKVPDWGVALDRSFFQLFAIMALATAIYLTEKREAK